MSVGRHLFPFPLRQRLRTVRTPRHQAIDRSLAPRSAAQHHQRQIACSHSAPLVVFPRKAEHTDGVEKRNWTSRPCFFFYLSHDVQLSESARLTLGYWQPRASAEWDFTPLGPPCLVYATPLSGEDQSDCQGFLFSPQTATVNANCHGPAPASLRCINLRPPVGADSGNPF